MQYKKYNSGKIGDTPISTNVDMPVECDAQDRETLNCLWTKSVLNEKKNQGKRENRKT